MSCEIELEDKINQIVNEKILQIVEKQKYLEAQKLVEKYWSTQYCNISQLDNDEKARIKSNYVIYGFICLFLAYAIFITYILCRIRLVKYINGSTKKRSTKITTPLDHFISAFTTYYEYIESILGRPDYHYCMFSIIEICTGIYISVGIGYVVVQVIEMFLQYCLQDISVILDPIILYSLYTTILLFLAQIFTFFFNLQCDI